jgi:hypothetical protein
MVISTRKRQDCSDCSTQWQRKELCPTTDPAALASIRAWRFGATVKMQNGEKKRVRNAHFTPNCACNLAGRAQRLTEALGAESGTGSCWAAFGWAAASCNAAGRGREPARGFGEAVAQSLHAGPIRDTRSGVLVFIRLYGRHVGLDPLEPDRLTYDR